MKKIQRALVSVSDKTSLVDFCRFLIDQSVQIISTGGTAKLLREHGLAVTDVAELTGFPEIMDGRVKTLHPKIHGGLLCVRDNPRHLDQAVEHKILTIDMVVANLYPFEQTISRKDFTHEEAVENIDIGGPSMIRSAAKNGKDVTVVVDPSDYGILEKEIEENNGATTPETRAKLSAKAFRHTASYDWLIASYLTSQAELQTPALQDIGGILCRRAQGLRYGENPHQNAGLYGNFLQNFRQLHGKELSYNNILDITAGVQLIGEFTEEPTLAILKHTNPCGVASAPTLHEAWEKAFATDKKSPFGGIIAVNRKLDVKTAEAIGDIFIEVVIAPSFEEDARKLLHQKRGRGLRLIENRFKRGNHLVEYHTALGSILIQDSDDVPDDTSEWKVVTKRQPTPDERKAMEFAWRVVKYVKSNAIVYAGSDRTLGVGAGQMARVDSANLAAWKANNSGLDLKGSAVASDAFFPFSDGVESAAQAGASAIIQPGGSIRDDEVIEAADKANLTMIFTSKRHFRH